MDIDNLIPPKTRPDKSNSKRNIIFSDRGRGISFTGYELIDIPNPSFLVSKSVFCIR